MLAAITSAILAILLASADHAYGFEQDLEQFNRFVQASTGSNAAIKLLREGRDLIQDEEWSKASERFNEFIRRYPRDENLDAALYWLSYSLMKQGKYIEADQRAARVIAEFPKSSWLDAARAIRLQAAPQINPTAVEVPDTANVEIKTIALQSLFQANPDRALELANDILKPDSKEHKKLRENTINLVAQYGGSKGAALLMDVARREPDMKIRRTAIYYLGRSSDEAAQNLLREIAMSNPDEELARAAVAGISRQQGPKATETLSQIARTASAKDVRRDAVAYLGQRPGEEIVEELMKIYNGAQDAELKRQVVASLSRRGNPSARVRLWEIARSDPNMEVKATAIHYLAQKGDDETIAQMIKVYDAENNEEIRKHVLSALARSKNQQARDKIIQVARTATDLDMRKTAIAYLIRHDDPQSGDLLIQLYDAEQNKEIKAAILGQLARTAPQPAATGQIPDSAARRKLLDVARNDPSPELRRAAINGINSRLLGAQTVETLIQLYDAEKTPEIRSDLIQRIGRWSGIATTDLAVKLPQADITASQKRALRKLMDISRNDSSVELRKQAVLWIGRSKDPEASKYLEEIVK